MNGLGKLPKPFRKLDRTELSTTNQPRPWPAEGLFLTRWYTMCRFVEGRVRGVMGLGCHSSKLFVLGKSCCCAKFSASFLMNGMDNAPKLGYETLGLSKHFHGIRPLDFRQLLIEG